jgi:hypothetical protein
MRIHFLGTNVGRVVVCFLVAAIFLVQPIALAFAEEVFDPPTISNPNLFTSRSSLPDVDQSTGAFVHRVPLDIPPGRNGLTPDLALQYNSQQLDDGIVGYGWSLSLPYIERFNRTGIDRLYTDNYFTSSLGGELATTSTAGEYRHRFEDGRFMRTRSPATRGSRTTRRERSTRSVHRRRRSCTRRHRRAVCTAG